MSQRRHELATEGTYASICHPQYANIIVIMLALLVQWPTILIIAMFSVLVVVYFRLAKIEKREAIGEFGYACRNHGKDAPGFIPKLSGGRADTFMIFVLAAVSDTYPDAAL